MNVNDLYIQLCQVMSFYNASIHIYMYILVLNKSQVSTTRVCAGENEHFYTVNQK